MDESNPLEEIRSWEHPSWYCSDQFKETIIMIFLKESEGSLPPPHDSFPDAGEVNHDFWSIPGNFKYRHHVEPRVKLYSSREESFPIPQKYIDVTRTAHTNLDVKQERRIDDYWNVVGPRDLSDPWTGFTQFTLLEENSQTDMCDLGGVIDEKTADIQARSFMARALEVNGKECQAEGEAKVVEWKAPSEQRTKIARDLFHWSGGHRIQGDHQECSKEIGNIDCSCYVLQNYEEELWEWCIQEN